MATPSRSGHALVADEESVARATRGLVLITRARASLPMRVTIVAAQLRDASRVPESFGSLVAMHNPSSRCITYSVCARCVPSRIGFSREVYKSLI